MELGGEGGKTSKEDSKGSLGYGEGGHFCTKN